VKEELITENPDAPLSTGLLFLILLICGAVIAGGTIAGIWYYRKRKSEMDFNNGIIGTLSESDYGIGRGEEPFGAGGFGGYSTGGRSEKEHRFTIQ
jgi:hypothetical protein